MIVQNSLFNGGDLPENNCHMYIIIVESYPLLQTLPDFGKRYKLLIVLYEIKLARMTRAFLFKKDSSSFCFIFLFILLLFFHFLFFPAFSSPLLSCPFPSILFYPFHFLFVSCARNISGVTKKKTTGCYLEERIASQCLTLLVVIMYSLNCWSDISSPSWDFRYAHFLCVLTIPCETCFYIYKCELWL